MWQKAYELLCIVFLQYEQFFTDWNAMALLNINRNCSSCPGTTHMSLIVGDWICSVIIKTTMEIGPWTLITYSAYVLIIWHLLYGMWCNSKPLAMICLSLLRLLQYWYHLFRPVGRCYCRLFFMFWINLHASIWRQQAHTWLNCIGRVCGQTGMEAMSIAHMQMILAWRHLS